MRDVRGLLRHLASVDQRVAVWCACQCAHTVVPPGARITRPASRSLTVEQTIVLAEDWVRGRATRAACSDAADEMSRRWSIGSAASAHAVRAAALADPDDPDVVPDLADAVAAAADATAAAMARHAGDDTVRPHHLDRLAALVRAERWPLTVVTGGRQQRGADAVRIAWDLVSQDHRTEHTIPELVEAHARAERLGLDWSDLVQRAVAERIRDDARVLAVLATGRP